MELNIRPQGSELTNMTLPVSKHMHWLQLPRGTRVPRHVGLLYYLPVFIISIVPENTNEEIKYVKKQKKNTST